MSNLAFAFICVRASSALVRTHAFLQPVVRGHVYIFEISPPLLAVWVAYFMTQLGIATQVYVIKVKVTVTKNRNSVSTQ